MLLIKKTWKRREVYLLLAIKKRGEGILVQKKVRVRISIIDSYNLKREENDPSARTALPCLVLLEEKKMFWFDLRITRSAIPISSFM